MYRAAFGVIKSVQITCCSAPKMLEEGMKF
jgi:hypothetical protein